MTVRYVNGIRVGAVTIDPLERVDTALWTHRPPRRAPARRVLTSAALARVWSPALGLPTGTSAVAMGFRIEMLPSGYGPGGAAVLLTRAGARTLVVGPTTRSLEPRRAERLVLFAAPEPTPPDVWLSAVHKTSGRLVVPDGAAATAVCEALDEAGVDHRRPRWLGRGAGPTRATVTVVIAAHHAAIDARPQADARWLVRYADQVGPRTVFVHGPRADALAAALAARGHAVRVLFAPRQLSFLDDDPTPTALVDAQSAGEEIDLR